MRLKLALSGGAAVILAMGWPPGQAGAGGVTAAASPSAQDTAAQGPPRAGLALGLEPLPLPYSTDLVSLLPDPSRQLPELRIGARSFGEVWAEEMAVKSWGWAAALWLRSRPLAGPIPQAGALAVEAPTPPVEVAGEVAVEAAAGEQAAGPPVSEEQGTISDVLGQYADIGFEVEGRVEMGGGWNRFRPCDVTVQTNCSPSLIPTLTPDIQVGARVGGTISRRVHVSVDYDNRREFDAANNINLFYQGFEDEILQRLEVGDVSFPLPHSRYLTRGIPAGNFGVRATGQTGPVDFQAVWAQQRGDLGSRELQVGGTGQGFEQRATTILDDADYERGRFFFLFSPIHLAGYPHVDIQQLLAADAESSVRPASVVKVYRYEVLGVDVGAQIPEGFITAVAVAEDTLQTELGVDTVVVDTLTGLFRPLIEGEDYILHQSGLWLQLRNTLAAQEGLAVTYINADGDEVGTFDAERASDAHNADPENNPAPILELIKGVNHRPGTATWRREMHHIYRISVSPGVVLSSVELTISQGDPEVGNTFRSTPSGTQLEFLKIFGLDDNPTDNVLDGSRIYDAGETSGSGTAGPTGTYIVPPTLEPFQAPPPLRDVSDPLNGQPFPLAPGDRNSAIYDEPNDQIRLGSNLYLLSVNYRQRFEGVLSTISLGFGGVREGSERVLIDGRELTRGEDYIIDYDVGQIELRDPDRWFLDNPDARLRVTFEQKPLFQLAPTSVFGLQARYALGPVGELNFIGLSQSEKTLQTRPELGLEPSAVQLGGVSARLDFRPEWLTGLANALPGVDTDAPSSITLDGELALSLPSTNTQGVTYVEDFEGGSGFTASMLSRAWKLGAAPASNAGAETVAPPLLDESNAGELVWQDQYTVQTPEGEAVFGGLFPRQIDDQLLVQGQTRPEPVLSMTFRMPENRRLAPNPNPAPGPAWASVTDVLAANGQDLTTIEFLEFYVAVDDATVDSTDLIIDLGTVSEDAFAIDSLGLPSGLGRLDREVDPPQIWSNADDIGLWGTGCEAEPGTRIYSLGDIAANCTRGNGLEDSEDLNQNGVLDGEERFFRYTVELGDPTGPYFVREASEIGGGRFRLFRVPLRRPDHRERVSDADFQNVRHLRLTVVSQSDNRLILARLRFLGSRWLKRGSSGVVEGLTDTTTVTLPETPVEVGPISTLDARYQPPPGVTDQVANRSDQYGLGGVTINEQSLHIRFSELGPDQRAEVYLQYLQTPRNLLSYRGLRVWALGIDGPWGVGGGAPLRFFVKLGEDIGNYYLYQTELAEVPPGAAGEALRRAWLPEITIDLDRFIALRARAEDIMLRQGGLPGDSALKIWDVDVFPDGDSTYAIVIGQRSRAPNLAAIRQVSLGAHNTSLDPFTSGELWVDDLRLDLPVDNAGMVGRIDMDVRASDVLGLNFSYSSENPYFRQLTQDPSFRSGSEYSLGGRLEFGRMLPDSWGLNLPLNVTYLRSGTKPLLLPRTDIAAEQLPGLRTPENRNFRMDLTLSKRPADAAPGLGWLVDNSSVRLTYDRRSGRTSRSEVESSGFTASYSFRDRVGDISIPLFPGPLEYLVFFLPESVRHSRLRLTPTALQLGATYVDNEAETKRFEEIVGLPADTGVVPVLTLDQRLQTITTVNFEPLADLTGRVFFTQGRDLVPTEHVLQGNRSQELVDAERASVLGIDLGWVVARSLDVNWTYRPVIASWLTPQFAYDSRFDLNTGPSYVDEQESDTVLTRDFGSSRSVRISTGFNTSAFFRSIAGQGRSGIVGTVLGLMDRIDVFSVTWVTTMGSSFRRRAASPSLGYQLGFGGLDDFRIQQGDTASRVADTETLALSTGLRLPLGLGLNVDYSTNDLFSWSPLTRTRTRQTTWPNLGLSWSRLPIPRFLQGWIAGLGFRAGYTVRENTSVIRDADQDRGSRITTIPFSVDLALTTQWSFTYSLTYTDEERFDATGVTLRDQTGHTFQLTGQFRPLSTTGSLRNPIRFSLRYSQNGQNQCRRLQSAFATLPPLPDPAAPCEPFTDLAIRDLGLTVNTDVTPFVVGLQAFWRDTQSELGQRPGSTQLEISLFGQFLFETGEIR